MIDYTQVQLYVMYGFLIVASAVGAYLKIYTSDIAVYVLVTIVGHFMGVLTPAPTKAATAAQGEATAAVAQAKVEEPTKVT